MQIFLAVFLFILAVVLFLAKKAIKNDDLERAANIGGVIATIAAIIVLAFYTASPGKEEPQVSSMPVTMTPDHAMNQVVENPSATWTSVPTSTAILTVVPNPTATWTAVHPPTQTVTVPIAEDTFIDNRNGWYLDAKSSYIAAGKYTQVISCPAKYSSEYCVNYLKVPFTLPSNFRMEIDATVLVSSIDAKVGVGFQIRRNTSGDYYYINYHITDIFYGLSLVYKGEQFRIIPPTTEVLIDNNPGATNRLGIEARNTEFMPIVNSQNMTSVEDGNLPDAGDAYLLIFVSRGQSTTIQLDNFIIQKWNSTD